MSTSSLRRLARLHTPSYQSYSRPARYIVHHAARIQLRPISSTSSQRAKVRVTASFAQVRFAITDVPPLSFFTARAQPPLVLDNEVTAAECHEACRRYAALAIEDRPGWRQEELSSYPTAGTHSKSKIPMYTLHYVALMIMQSPKAGGHLATHILHTGVTLGYAPSVMTMVRIGLRRNLLERPQFAASMVALYQLVSSTSTTAKSSSSSSSGSSYYRPDIVTSCGILAARLGTPAGDAMALRYFGEAGKAAATITTPQTSPSENLQSVAWQWRATAALEVSAIHLRQKQPERAKAVLRAAAQELDNAEVCFQYAMLLDSPSEEAERVALLERAAVSGVEGAAREMGRLELSWLEKEEKEGGKEEGKGALSTRERRFIADEWLGIAGDKAII